MRNLISVVAFLPGVILATTTLAVTTTAQGAAAPRFSILADAGSTGTRVYVFKLPPGADARVEVQDVGKGPALSSFREAPGRSHESVANQLQAATLLIPEGLRRQVSVSVFATAGMRLVESAKQEAIYEGLKTGILAVPGGYPFDAGKLQARTISGREEGVFALIAANYLSRNLRPPLEAAAEGALMGVLDLGGSSTQIATPPVLSAGDSFGERLGEQHTFVRSFLNLGMERMRARTYERFVDAAPKSVRSKRSVSNPCSFHGLSEEGQAWRGTGDSRQCEAAVTATLEEERLRCNREAKDATTTCLDTAPVSVPAGPASKPKFYLISGYMYVTDFAGWLIDQPGVRPNDFSSPSGRRPYETPTIQELRNAADVVCSEPWSTIKLLYERTKHRFTSAQKAAHRCFEINYIVALLVNGYGLPQDERLFHIVDEIDGGEIEWSLGAFLHELGSAVDTVAQEL